MEEGVQLTMSQRFSLGVPGHSSSQVFRSPMHHAPVARVSTQLAYSASSPETEETQRKWGEGPIKEQESGLTSVAELHVPGHDVKLLKRRRLLVVRGGREGRGQGEEDGSGAHFVLFLCRVVDLTVQFSSQLKFDLWIRKVPVWMMRERSAGWDVGNSSVASEDHD